MRRRRMGALLAEDGGNGRAAGRPVPEPGRCAPALVNCDDESDYYRMGSTCSWPGSRLRWRNQPVDSRPDRKAHSTNGICSGSRPHRMSPVPRRFPARTQGHRHVGRKHADQHAGGQHPTHAPRRRHGHHRRTEQLRTAAEVDQFSSVGQRSRHDGDERPGSREVQHTRPTQQSDEKCRGGTRPGTHSAHGAPSPAWRCHFTVSESSRRR